MYFEHATKMAVSNGLFSIYENLGIQMHGFVQDEYRCVFTFDRLKCSPDTDLIIPLFWQDVCLSNEESQRKCLQSLHLDYFHDYETRFGCRVVYNGAVATFVLFKNKQLFAFEHVAQLCHCHHSFAPHGQILDLLSRWDHNRPNTEKLLIHLLFAEIPPAFGCGNFCNQSVVSLFEEIRISHHDTYELMEALWRKFLAIMLTL